MENATKALVMAGGVLIALMVIGALMLMADSITAYQKTDIESTRTSQAVEFNNQYETYNRLDVRGNELYSLLNRARDYNQRQTASGYTPIEIVFSFAGKLDEFESPAGNNLITKDTYKLTGTSSEFDSIMQTVTTIEGKYGADSLTNLITAMTSIFIEDTASVQERNVALDTFNLNSSKVKARNWNEIKEGSTIRSEVYKYREYVLFKRAYFDCTSLTRNGESGVTYDEKNGRIIKMEFKFNGKFN